MFVGALAGVFESDGRTFVYTQSAKGFVPHDVKLVRRSESQVVLGGRETRASSWRLARPEDQMRKAPAGEKRRHEGDCEMIRRLLSDLAQALANLRAHKTRTMLTAMASCSGWVR